MPAETNAEKTSRCPTCGKGELRPQAVTQRFEYEGGGERVTVVAENVPVKVCDACGETLSGPAAAHIHTEAIGRALGLLSPTEIRSLRERLGKTPEEFARLTGIRAEDLREWERARTLPSRALDRYLRLLAANPENVKLLEGWPPVSTLPVPSPANGTPQRQDSVAMKPE
jgi:putative zinc finger/helix-turn-helix YgiT family protein